MSAVFPWKAEVDVILADPLAYARRLVHLPAEGLANVLGQFQTIATATTMAWYADVEGDLRFCLYLVEQESERRQKIISYQQGVACRLEEMQTADVIGTMAAADEHAQRLRMVEDDHDVFSALARMDDAMVKECRAAIVGRGKILGEGNSPRNLF